jgi:hypothetical protein
VAYAFYHIAEATEEDSRRASDASIRNNSSRTSQARGDEQEQELKQEQGQGQDRGKQGGGRRKETSMVLPTDCDGKYHGGDRGTGRCVGVCIVYSI